MRNRRRQRQPLKYRISKWKKRFTKKRLKEDYAIFKRMYVLTTYNIFQEQLHSRYVSKQDMMKDWKQNRETDRKNHRLRTWRRWNREGVGKYKTLPTYVGLVLGWWIHVKAIAFFLFGNKRNK